MMFARGWGRGVSVAKPCIEIPDTLATWLRIS